MPVPEISETQQAAIRALAHDEKVIRAPVWLARDAYISNDAVERSHAADDPGEFWAEKARQGDRLDRSRGARS